MNKLSISLTTNEDKEAVVNFNAQFADQSEAIAFHAKLADLCKQSKSLRGVASDPNWTQRLLPSGIRS